MQSNALRSVIGEYMNEHEKLWSVKCRAVNESGHIDNEWSKFNSGGKLT